MITRKKFLQLSTLSVGALFIPDLFSSKSSFPLSPITDVNLLLKEAKFFRKQKKWNKAKNTYQQILQTNPQEVRAYDGLKKCIFQQPKQEKIYMQMLEDAVSQFPDNKLLKQRLYSQYVQTALGNRKVSKQKNANLLLHAKQKMELLAAQYPNDLSLQKQLNKVCTRLNSNAGEVHYKNNPGLKQQHKQNQKTFKKRFDAFNKDQLYTKLTVLKSKPYNKEREKHIRELYLMLVKRNVKTHDINQAAIIAKEYHNLYPKDRSAIYWMRRLGDKKNDAQFIIQTEEKNHQTQQTFWSASAYFTAVKKYQSSNTGKLQQLVTEMEQTSTEAHQDLILYCKKIELSLLQNQVTQAETQLNLLLTSKAGIKNTSIIDSINVLTVKYLVKTQQGAMAKNMPYIIINAKDLVTSSDIWEKKIAQLNQYRDFSKPVYLEKFQNYLKKI
ncbi:tetratricopeptide repeat protein [Chryseobacterium cheonjiense]|uniref:Tetratricopeptide repeat protein n=1 Tax=Chryseobacterium cheonjiense TaxID=2728845 RepID=A0A7Y0A845_9FLAO|nr:hypothetical protein [Chryseobacterium cheonjiense]NML58409.1 hypothetical protein [Chryseobacterium cheonjiense]